MPHEGRVGRGGLLVAVVAVLALNSAYLAATSAVSTFYVVQLLLHPVLGVVAAALCARWWWRRRGDRATWWGGWLVWASVLTGVALPAVAAAGTAAPLRALHVVLGVAGALLLLWARNPWRQGSVAAGRRAWGAAVVAGAALLLVPLLAGMASPAPEPPLWLDNPPAGPSMAEEAMGGREGPFYPSAVHAAGGGPLPPASSCGGGDCHERAVAEWESSPHRWSGRDNPWYRASVLQLTESRGELSARWCAGCHEPGMLVTRPPPDGAVPAGSRPEIAAPGVSCATCHGMVAVRSTIGQGHYELGSSALQRLAGGAPWQRRLHRWTVRLDPAAHRRAWTPAVLTGPTASETCGTCHKSHLDAAVNGHRWFQDMNDYDQWQGSHVSGYGGRSFYRPEPQSCVDCHMPRDAAGRRSHRFAAADAGAALLSGDPRQLEAVAESLASGAVTVDLFAVTTGEHTLAPLDGARVPAGASLRLDAVVATPGMGHFFPGGKIDTADAWLELRVDDAAGRPVSWSGRQGEDGEAGAGAHRYGLRLLDAAGEPVEHRDVWRARAEVYRSWVVPLTAEVVRYRVDLPPELSGPLQVTARLHYRELSPAFQAWVRERLGAGAEEVPEVPVLLVAEDAARLEVVAAGEAPAVTAVGGPESWRRFNDYGIGLLLQGDGRGARAAFRRVTELRPDYADGWLNLAWTTSIEGDLEATAAAVERAEALEPELARTLFFRGRLEQLRGDNTAASEAYGRAAALYPRDRVIRVYRMQTLMALAEHEAALEEVGHLLSIDPQYSLAHYNAMLAHRALGDTEAAERHQRLYDRFRPDDSALDLTGPYLEAHPDDNRERQAIHEHAMAGPAAAAGAAAGGAR